jgi:hypothetical protein
VLYKVYVFCADTNNRSAYRLCKGNAQLMRLSNILESFVTQLGGESYAQLKLQAQVIKAAKSTGSSSRKSALNAGNTVGNNPFLQALSQLQPPQVPTPPTDLTNLEAVSQYNQALLVYINRLNAQQAVTSQRTAQQMQQLIQVLQRGGFGQGGFGQGAQASASVGNNTAYPASSSLSQLSGVVNTSRSNSLLLDSTSA